MPGLMHKLCVLAAHWVRETAPEREGGRERERERETERAREGKGTRCANSRNIKSRLLTAEQCDPHLSHAQGFHGT